VCIILLLCLKTAWWYILNKVYRAFFGLSVSDIVRTVVVDKEKKADALKKSQTSINILQSQMFFIHLLLTIVCTLLFVYLFDSVSVGEVNSFDSFYIGRIDPSAVMMEIKKVYRKTIVEYLTKNKVGLYSGRQELWDMV